MALNQVIHGSNRVVENPNRYKLNSVSGQANTYDLEKQPGVITDNGTPYNKLILDKIDNVLSYLTPSVEKVQSGIEEKTLVQNILSIDINPTWTSSSDIIGNSIFGNLTSYDNITPTYEYKTNVEFQPSSSSSVASNYVRVFSRSGSSNKVTSSQFLTNDSVTSSSNYNAFRVYNNNIDEFYKIYDMKIPCKPIFKYLIEKIGSVSYNKSGTFEVSNDGINWVYYEDVYSNSSSSYTITVTDYYRYFRFRFGATGDSSNLYKIYNLYISNVTYQITSYQNQFTLDNNTSFTNNQRVIIETPTTNDYNIKQDFITSTDGLNAVNSDGFIITAKSLNPSGIFSLANSVNGNFNDNGYASEWNTIINNEEYIIYEFPKTLNFTKIIERINWDSWAFTRPKLSYSNDGVTYIDLIDVGTSDDTKSEHLVNFSAKYIKISATTNSTTGNTYLRVKEINFYTQDGMTTDGVKSNTLNGIDIPTLLKPNTKYELVYKEGTNKFEFGNLTEKQPLFDITLMEAVNQVDLTGISDMLEEGKIYALYVIGSTSVAGSIKFGNSYCGSLESSPYRSFNIIFAPFIDNSNIKRVSYMCAINSQFQYINSQITDNEYIKCDTNSTTFNAGTRIVIKEVA